jgi:hypothetical protein
MAPEVKDTTPSDEDYRKAAAISRRDPLWIDRENARLFAADPANRSFEAQMYQKKIAEGTATPFEEDLADAYAERARNEVAAKEAPELEAAARYRKTVDAYGSGSGNPVEKARSAQEVMTTEMSKPEQPIVVGKSKRAKAKATSKTKSRIAKK